jgi:endonuclease/exonuclease/phosphatase (EEP) superfamily protein YafD
MALRASMTRLHLRIAAALLSMTPLVSVALTPGERVSASQYCDQNQPMDSADNLSLGLNPYNIKLLNWNVQKATHPDLSTDLARLMPGVDLVTFQEARLQAAPVDALEAYSHALFAVGYTTSTQTTGVLTVSKTPPLSHCRLSHQEPWLGTPKATSVSYFSIAERALSLMVINLHAVNFTVGSADFQQQIGDAALLIRAHSGPVVFAGDFNTWNASRQSSLLELVDELGLEAVVFADDQRVQVLGYTLDHILVRGLDVIDSQTYQMDSSDHNPQAVVLSVRS